MFEFLYSVQIGKLALVDFLIVAVYLLLVLLIGAMYSKKVTSFREYAIGVGDFNTTALTCTIVATFISSGDIIGLIEAVYSKGFIWVWIFMGIITGNLLIMKYIAPNIYHYKDSLSVGELINKIYGKKPALITAISGLLDAVGSITLEIMALEIICQTFFSTPPFVGLIIGASIIIIYSFSGGIYSVTITDIIQFLFLAVAIPSIFHICFMEVGSYSKLINSVPKEVFNFSIENVSNLQITSLFLLFYLPFLRPTIIQRLLMAKNSEQISEALAISSLFYIMFYITIGGIGLLCLHYYPAENSNAVFLKLFDEKLPNIVKGIALCGLMAALMSSADSELNSASILISNDIIRILKPDLEEKTLLKIAKLSTILIGILAVLSSMFFKKMIDVMLTFYSFWLPVVTVPLFFGIIGFRASSRTFLTAAACGFSIFLIWKIFGLEEKLGIDHLFLCVLTNSIVFFTMRHFEKDKLPESFVKVEPYGDVKLNSIVN